MQLLWDKSRLLLTGDFNIHVDQKDDNFAINFSQLLESHDLVQHVGVSTHVNGHTLD